MNYNFVHVSSFVDDNVVIGKGTEILNFCHMQEGCRVGDNCSFDHYVVIGKNVQVGNECTIQSGVSVPEGVTLEEGVYLGSSMVFTNDRIPRGRTTKGHQVYKDTVVGEGATVGANATIVCGNDIGKFAMIAAGAVVLQPVKNYALMAGVPAKKIGWVCECGEILHYGLDCAKCGEKYREVNGDLERV
ncbi:MAG: acyltransferase [Anaerovoracaceae bacterium]|jgi:UDP-2-acetamido-3-amino-2,3-dideoxy-glucuronate N-acetyltransferase